MRNQRSNLMLIASLVGLALGVPLALSGWSGLEYLLSFFRDQGPRMLGGLVVLLSVAVLVRQIRAHLVRTAHQPDPGQKGQGQAAPASVGGASSPPGP